VVRKQDPGERDKGPRVIVVDLRVKEDHGSLSISRHIVSEVEETFG